MRDPSQYAAALRGLSDADLAAELRHVASGMAREARGTRERDWWEECYRYVWGEYTRRYALGCRALRFTRERDEGWAVGLRGGLCDSPLPVPE